MKAHGRLLDLHRLGAVVRLDDGRLGAIPLAVCAVNREMLADACRRKTVLAFEATEIRGRLVLAPVREPQAPLAPSVPRLVDDAFEAKLAAYARSIEATWAPPDVPEPAERERERKRKTRRARDFEAPPGRA